MPRFLAAVGQIALGILAIASAVCVGIWMYKGTSILASRMYPTHAGDLGTAT